MKKGTLVFKGILLTGIILLLFCNVVSAEEYGYYPICGFSENKAWVKYSALGTEYLGCIDNSGKILFSFPCSSSYQEGYRFKDGFSKIVDGNTAYIINSSGEKSNPYNEKELKAWGGGYAFLEKYSSGGFDEAPGYKYTIEDFDGNIIGELPYTDQIYGIKYNGCGVFTYLTTAYADGVRVFNSVKGIEITPSLLMDYNVGYKFYDESHGYLISKAAWDGNDILVLDIQDDTDRVITIPAEYGNSFELMGLWNGIIALYSHSDNLYIFYDIDSDTFTKYSGQYSDKVTSPDGTYSGDVHFQNGILAISLIGADGKSYYALIDTDMNTVLEPFQAYELSFCDNTAILVRLGDQFSFTPAIYDWSGTLLWNNISLSLNRYDISDGIVFCENEYYDYYGNPAIEKVFDTADNNKEAKAETDTTNLDGVWVNELGDEFWYIQGNTMTPYLKMNNGEITSIGISDEFVFENNMLCFTSSPESKMLYSPEYDSLTDDFGIMTYTRTDIAIEDLTSGSY